MQIRPVDSQKKNSLIDFIAHEVSVWDNSLKSLFNRHLGVHFTKSVCGLFDTKEGLSPFFLFKYLNKPKCWKWRHVYRKSDKKSILVATLVVALLSLSGRLSCRTRIRFIFHSFLTRILLKVFLSVPLLFLVYCFPVSYVLPFVFNLNSIYLFFIYTNSGYFFGVDFSRTRFYCKWFSQICFVTSFSYFLSDYLSS